MKIPDLNALLLEFPRQGRGLGKIYLAAEMVESNGFEFHPAKIGLFTHKAFHDHEGNDYPY